MENKINIAEIIRDMPKGTKLYSPLFGKCELGKINTDKGEEYIHVEYRLEDEKKCAIFSSDGRYFDWIKDAECLLFPSDKMRDWDKFFKRGDIVYNPYSQMYAVFDGWANDDYTEFNTTIDYYKIGDKWGKEDICCTGIHRKATDEERAKFIAAAEEYYGGKYNPETLYVDSAKVVEPKCPFEPFQKVLVRDFCDERWRANYFSHYDEDNSFFPYYCVGCCYKVCIAYEGNEHLLGTDKSPE